MRSDEISEDEMKMNVADVQYGKYFKTSQNYKTVMPDLTGYPAMDAVSILENMGMKVNLIGNGKVKKQSIKSGTKISNNQHVNLISG